MAVQTSSIMAVYYLVFALAPFWSDWNGDYELSEAQYYIQAIIPELLPQIFLFTTIVVKYSYNRITTKLKDNIDSL